MPVCPAPDRIGCGDLFNLRVGARSMPRAVSLRGGFFRRAGPFVRCIANFLPGAQPRLDPGAPEDNPLRRARPLALRGWETAWGL